jgi:predicted amidohydrolase
MRTPFAVLCLLLGACAEPQAADIAIRGATVVDVASGSLIPDQTILIIGNRIVAVGRTDELRVAPETDLVDAAGGYLIPGLWDTHVHSVGDVAGDADAEAPANHEWHFPLFLAHGVTGVRDMGDPEDISNTQQIRAVVVDGRLYRRADLDRIVAEMQASNQRAKHRE